MGKEKRTGDWIVFLQSGAISLMVYVVSVCLLALLMVKGLVSEGAGWGGLIGVGFLSVMTGGVAAARRSSFATLPSAVISTGVFLAVVILTGLAVWPECFWGERSVVLMLSMLLGGVAAGIWAAGKRARGKKRRVRVGGK